jgi:bifunctional enzyme CysN/CysC/sulfate adenylyltransferase subunit 1
LLEYLETVPLAALEAKHGPLRFPVQLVVRPDATFRGFAGRVERGEVRPGLTVKALPSGRTTRVKTIVTYDGDLKSATFPQSVTLELEDEIDLSRGEMLIAESQQPPHTSTRFRAMVVWMAEDPLVVGKSYLIKHTTRTVRGTIRAIRYSVEVNTAEHRDATQLAMNDIAEVEFDTSLPLFFDTYVENREMGAFILIDAITNATVGAAMINATVEDEASDSLHQPAFLLIPGDIAAATTIYNHLHHRGRRAVVIDDPLIPDATLPAAARALQLAGVTAISARANLSAETIAALKASMGDHLVEGPEAARLWLETNA